MTFSLVPQKETPINLKRGSRLIRNSQVAQALTILGDRWAFLTIRDVYQGARKFEELRRLSGAARGTLTSRLQSLVNNGILFRSPYRASPVRFEYRLTDKGLDLYPIVIAVWAWEVRWGEGEQIPPEIVHRVCGASMQPVFRCKQCKGAVHIDDCDYIANVGAAENRDVTAGIQRRSRNRGKLDYCVDQRFFHYLDVVGDRWTALVLAAAFFGLRRYDQILASVGMATNILSDRLKLLVSAGVLKRVQYKDRPTRFEYHLSDKGRDLYLPTIALHEWANRWLIEKSERPITVIHRPCGKELVTEVVCDQCGGLLKPTDVSYAAD